MIYRRTNRQAGHFPIKLMVLTAAILLFLLLSWPRSFIRNTFVAVIGKLTPEREATIESEKISLLLSQIFALKQENTSLRSALAGKQPAEKHLLAAKPVFGGGFLFNDVLFINEGTSAGVSMGNPAIYENMLIGFISETGTNWSKVEPVGFIGQKITLRAGNAVFEATGSGGGELNASLPQGNSLQIGDALWWGGNSGYIAGIINNVETVKDSGAQTIHISRPAALTAATDIFVILN